LSHRTISSYLAAIVSSLVISAMFWEMMARSGSGEETRQKQ